MNTVTTTTGRLGPIRIPLRIGLSMILAALLAVWMKPSQRPPAHPKAVNLETLIPTRFGRWKAEASPVARMVSPELQATIDKVYLETLSRTYIDDKGERVMLSIAYGQNKSDNRSIHLPEGCYPGAGFAVSDTVKGFLPTSFGGIPVSRLVATKELRNEPITYWVMVGDKPTRDFWEMKKAKIINTLKGQEYAGMLVRISSISADSDGAFKLQQDFAESMLAALSAEQRKRLAGFQLK